MEYLVCKILKHRENESKSKANASGSIDSDEDETYPEQSASGPSSAKSRQVTRQSHQRQTMKRVRSFNAEAERGSKRPKHCPEVICPRLCLVARLQLTSEKMSRDHLNLQTKSGLSEPATAGTSRLQSQSDGASHNDRSSTLYALAARSGQEAASKRQRIARLANTQALGSNTLPASAAPSHASDGNDAAGQTTVRVTPPNPAKPSTANVLTGPVRLTTNRNRSDKPSQLPEGIMMLIYIERNDEEARGVGASNVEGVATTRSLFKAVHDHAAQLLGADEIIVRVDVKQLSALPASEELMASFMMRPKMVRSGRDQSWEHLLRGLRDRAVETGVSVEMKLKATVLIGKAGEQSPRYP